MPAKRYSLQSDNSGHEYIIPCGMEMEFEAWVEAAASDAEDDLGDIDFETYLLNGGPLTFTDPMIGDKKFRLNVTPSASPGERE